MAGKELIKLREVQQAIDQLLALQRRSYIDRLVWFRLSPKKRVLAKILDVNIVMGDVVFFLGAPRGCATIPGFHYADSFEFV